jgi:DNA-binding NtrC family response regulator
VRASHGGTLLLDEIAELPEASQASLLRVLQEREVVPVGDTRPHRVDLRVVAATHQDLPAAIGEGRFRQDLYARLNGHVLRLPALRERREDLGILIRTLLPRIAGERADRITLERAAARALCRYDWPLNIRELEQCLTAALALAPGDQIELEHLPASVRRGPLPAGTRPDAPDADLRARLDASLRAHDGNLSAVARDLGKARMQVRRWCKRLGLDPDRYRRD